MPPKSNPSKGRIEPANRLYGTVHLPGDKSISHRCAMFAALAQGTSVIKNFSSSEDCTSTLACLQQLGVKIDRVGSRVTLSSPGRKNLVQPPGTLNAGNSGTAIRLLSGILAGLPFETSIEGDASVNQRPMRRIIVPLRKMGCQVRATEDKFPPLHIRGGNLKGIKYNLPVASAQVKSAILLAGLAAEQETVVIEPSPCRDHTERLFPEFGIQINVSGRTISIAPGQEATPSKLTVPGDFSAASFFLISALLLPGSHLKMSNVGINPSRDALLKLLAQSGAKVTVGNRRIVSGEPVADLQIEYSQQLLEMFPSCIEGSLIPQLIDEIPILAVLGTRLKSGLTIKDAEELRTKETDRIHAVVSNLRALGIETEERQDGFAIPPGQTIQGGLVRTYGDHRIAMSFAIAGLIALDAVHLDDPDCCSISFPDFFRNLSAVTE
jgi:3-phosphoshikimate 1-carboxyvinyltransferase